MRDDDDDVEEGSTVKRDLGDESIIFISLSFCLFYIFFVGGGLRRVVGLSLT